MKKSLATALTAVTLVVVLTFGLAQSAGATDPTRQLQRQINRLKNQVTTLENNINSLQTNLSSLRADLNAAISDGRVTCLSEFNVTQYTDYQSIDGGSISGLDVTESGDTADWRVATWTC